MQRGVLSVVDNEFAAIASPSRSKTKCRRSSKKGMLSKQQKREILKAEFGSTTRQLTPRGHSGALDDEHILLMSPSTISDLDATNSEYSLSERGCSPMVAIADSANFSDMSRLALSSNVDNQDGKSDGGDFLLFSFRSPVD